MTEKPADNGPVDPAPADTRRLPAETQPEPDQTLREPDQTLRQPEPEPDQTLREPDQTLRQPDDTMQLSSQAEERGTDEPDAAGPRPTEPDAPGPDAPRPGTAGSGGPGFPPPPPPGGFPPPPPPGAFPPPSGSFFPPPQPTGGAFASRYGLIRPRHGRWFAGVAAAIGRATNTDPILWRVLFGVLTLFGGVGLLAYLLGWLLIPAEGDTASPAEALIGRGRSSTSAPLALGLAVATLIMFAVALSGDIRGALLGAAVILGAALLVSRGGTALGRPATRPPQPPPPGWPSRPEGPMPPAGPVPSDSTVPPAGTVPPGRPGPSGSPGPWGRPGPSAGPSPPAGAMPAGGPLLSQAPITGQPFAPHGPYASSSPYARSAGYAPPPPPPYPGLVQTPPRPPKPPRERSRLGRVVMSLICLALGALLIYDVAGHSVPGTAYLAAALAVIGLGLVVGSWLGRARWLIFPGLVLALILLIASTVGTLRAPGGAPRPWDFSHSDMARGSRTWTPPTLVDLQNSYTVDAGNGTLDLSSIDFTGQSRSVKVHVAVGNLVVILPPTVDVDVSARVDGGSAEVLGERWDGLGNDPREIHDTGTDGTGGGKLQLTTTVDLGKLEVRR